jgi:microcystin-dependent protein
VPEAFITEIRIFSFGFAPRGWAQCNGQLLRIQQNQAMYALMGTTYGGDGKETFALPDLRGRHMVHRGEGAGTGTVAQGKPGGEAGHVLTLDEMPPHTHEAIASESSPASPSPVGGHWATHPGNYYAATADQEMALEAVGGAGYHAPHENRSPYLVLNICIALEGLFPSRN